MPWPYHVSRRRKGLYRKKRPYGALLFPLIIILPLLAMHLYNDINLREHYRNFNVMSGALTSYGRTTRKKGKTHREEYLYFMIDNKVCGYLGAGLRDFFQQDRFEQEVQPGDTVTIVVNYAVKSAGEPTVVQVEANGTVYLSRKDSLLYFERLIRDGDKNAPRYYLFFSLYSLFLVLISDVPILFVDVFPEARQAIRDWMWRH